MKKLYFIFITLLFLNSIEILAFDELLFEPLAANVFEPRVGAQYEGKDKKLRLDIGSSIDLLELYKTPLAEIRAGADFFTFTRLRSEGNMKFPVETSDYFFGINTSAEFRKFQARLRVAHISSHIVDGLAKDTILSRRPFVYSREFVDLTIARRIKDFRFYAGFTYVFSTQPKAVKQVVPEFGLDFEVKINHNFAVKGGYDFKLTGKDNYIGLNAAQLGIALHTFDYFGLFAGVYYYSGLSMHGMFYDERTNYFGIGFQVHLKTKEKVKRPIL